MKLTQEQKEARKYFSKMSYWDFRRELKEKNEDGTEKPVTNPIIVMRFADDFFNRGMMDKRTNKRIIDGGFQVLYAARREWE